MEHDQQRDHRSGLRGWLIDDWCHAWRFWSVRMIAAALFVSSWPEAFLWLYSLVPLDIQFLLPGRTATIIICLVLAFAARVVKQKPVRSAGD